MRETVSYGILSNLDGEGWCEILPSQYTKNINIPDPVPTPISKEEKGKTLSLPFLSQQGDTIVKVRREDHVRVIVLCSFYPWGYF
jgi:hypothetical protein